MRLSTRSSILKSTTVEISAPRVLENSRLEYKKQTILYGVPADFSLLDLAGGSPLTGNLDLDIEPVVQPGQEEASGIIAEAKSRAESIVTEAQQQAQEILDKAQQQKEEFQAEIEARVRAEIIPLAQAEGLEQGLREAEQEAGRLKEQARKYLELAQKALQNESEKAERELLHLCIQISSKIIQAHFQHDPESLLNIIRNLNLLPREKEGIKIYLSPQDWEWYKELPSADKPSYPVVIDQSLGTGDTFIECSEGVFDARIGTQLEILEQYLFEELEHGRLDGFSK